MSRIGFIFDLDGTLVDSEKQIFDSVNSVRLANGFSALDYRICSALIGLPAEELFKDLGRDQECLKKLVKDFREILGTAILSGNKLFPGVLDFLTLSKARRIDLGIATNKPTNLAMKVVENSELSNFNFKVVGTGKLMPKPNPDTLLSCIESSTAEKFFMFGDRIEDMVAACNAKVIPVGISQSVHSLHLLKESGAEYVFESFEEALSNIDELTSIGETSAELF